MPCARASPGSTPNATTNALFFHANPKKNLKRMRRKVERKHAAWRDQTSYGKGVALQLTLSTAADGDAAENGDESESAEVVEEAEEESEDEYEVICDMCYDGKDAGRWQGGHALVRGRRVRQTLAPRLPRAQE